MNFDTATNTDTHQSEIEHADQMQQQENKNSHSSMEHDIARDFHGMKDFGIDTFSKLKFAAQTLWHHPVDFTENLLNNASHSLTDPENEIAYMLSGGKFGDPASIVRSEIRGESVLNYFSALANSQFGTAQQGYLIAEGLSWLIPVGAAKMLGVARNAAGMFGRGASVSEVASDARLISNITRVSSDKINKPFITEKALADGWKPPYPDNLSLRKITTAQELKFYRVHLDPNRVAGIFLAREKEIVPFLNDPEAMRLHLGLLDVPIYITEVNVPVNTELLVGRIGPQPSFGLMGESGFQYQAIRELPKSSFVNTRLLESKLNFDMNY